MTNLVAGNKEEQLQYFQRESHRLAEEIAKQQAKERKSEEKQIQKLEKAEAKAMNIANELSGQQARARECKKYINITNLHKILFKWSRKRSTAWLKPRRRLAVWPRKC